MALQKSMDGVAAKRVAEIEAPTAAAPEPDENTLTNMLNAYEAKFVNMQDGLAARAEFKVAHQGRDESGLDWHCRCRDLHLRAWRETPVPRDVDTHLIDRFVDGLANLAIHLDVVKGNPETYEGALRLVERMEAALTQSKARREMRHSDNPRINAMARGTPVVAPMGGGGARRGLPLARRGGFGNARPRPAWNRSDDRPFNTATPTSNFQGPTGLKTCFYCQVQGHLRRECPKLTEDLKAGAAAPSFGNRAVGQASTYHGGNARRGSWARGGARRGVNNMAYVEEDENERFENQADARTDRRSDAGNE